jgi:hypothetical protein
MMENTTIASVEEILSNVVDEKCSASPKASPLS